MLNKLSLETARERKKNEKLQAGYAEKPVT